MKAEIISTGTELLLGHTPDMDACIISNMLSELGIDIFRHVTIGDNKDRLSSAIKEAGERSNIVIIAGGLGPTVDDITISAIADAAKKNLVFNKDVFNQLKIYFDKRKVKLPKGAIKQALLPEGCEIIQNSVGTAPGIVLKDHDKYIIALPGPPGELECMVKNDIYQYLKKLRGAGRIIRSRGVKIIGLPEAAVDEKVKDLLSLSGDTTVGIYTYTGEVLLRITAKAMNKKAADKELDKLERVIRKRFADLVYGTDSDTLESVVGQFLTRSKKTIAVAESCTGGYISNLLTNVPGSSNYFTMGIVAYSNKIKTDKLGISADIIKKYGAVSKDVARLMAKNVRKLAGSNIGIGATGIAGPGGATKGKPVGLVYISLATEKKRIVKELRLSGTRQDIKIKASKQALDLIRRYFI